MDWLDESMKNSKQYQEQPDFKSILEQFAPNAVEKQIDAYKDDAKETATQTTKALPGALEKHLGLSHSDAQLFSSETALDNGQGVGSLTAIFVSFDMSAHQLKQAFEEADEENAELYFRGLHPEDKSISDSMKRLNQLMVDSEARPTARFHPKAFREFRVTHVPVLLHATKGNVARVSGLLNLGWLKDQMRFTQGLTNLGNRGPTTEVIERDLIEEMQARMRGLDMDSKKKKAVDQFWNKQSMVSIPNSTEDKEFFIDPTVRVREDIVNPNGDVLARAGDIINPISTVPSMNTYLLFNSRNPKHVEWVKSQVSSKGYNGIVMVMTSEIERDNGWEQLGKLRKELKREVYLIPKEMVERFAITGLPAIVTTDLKTNLLKIRQLVIEER
jgi:conjugal transfer pilus assembly protein TraW